jgi:hypothetical protein
LGAGSRHFALANIGVLGTVVQDVTRRFKRRERGPCEKYYDWLPRLNVFISDLQSQDPELLAFVDSTASTIRESLGMVGASYVGEPNNGQWIFETGLSDLFIWLDSMPEDVQIDIMRGIAKYTEEGTKVAFDWIETPRWSVEWKIPGPGWAVAVLYGPAPA